VPNYIKDLRIGGPLSFYTVCAHITVSVTYDTHSAYARYALFRFASPPSTAHTHCIKSTQENYTLWITSYIEMGGFFIYNGRGV